MHSLFGCHLTCLSYTFDQGSLLDDMWSLDLDFVQSLRESSLYTPSSPQMLFLESRSKHFLQFKLSPTHAHPHSRGVDEANVGLGQGNFQDQTHGWVES